MPEENAARGQADSIDLEEFRLDFEALARRDWERMQWLHHPDIEWHEFPELPGATVTRGRAAVRELLVSYSEALGQWRAEPIDIRTAGDKVLVISNLITRGRQSEIETAREFFQVFTLREGKIVEQRSYLHRHQALAAAGLSE